MDNEVIASKIYYLRGERVMLDADLASLYGAETRILNQAVKRNLSRFPGDFMFELTEAEFKDLKSQFVISSWGGRRKRPLAFTELGVAMLSSVLRSDRAIHVNMGIMRTFVALRRWMQSNRNLETKIRQLEGKYDQQFKVVFEAIRQLVREETQDRRPIGFRVSRD